MTLPSQVDTLLYRYDKDQSRPELQRLALRQKIGAHLLTGYGVPLYGGHGMGKSYLIRQIADDLGEIEGVTVHVLRPPEPTVSAAECVKMLGDALKIDVVVDGPVMTSYTAIVEAWLEHNPGQLVLIFDEVDVFVRGGAFARILFNSLEAVRKSDPEARFGILAAGGLGLVLLKTEWSSPFVSRGRTVYAPRFDLDEMAELATPLALGELEDELMSALLALSGGIPFLVTFGLRALLETPPYARRVDALRAGFERFFDECKPFLQCVWTALGSGPEHVQRAVLAAVHRAEGLVDSVTLRSAFTNHALDDIDLALDVLRAAGLVEIEGNFLSGRPATIRLVPSVLNLPPEPVVAAEAASIRARLRMDLGFILSHVQRWGVSFFRQGGRLVPEAAFQASISIALASLGWQHITQESQQGPGRTDIVAEHPDFDGQAVIEVKIWGRKGYDTICEQIERYRIAETAALATVIISDTQNLDGETFRTKSLNGTGEPIQDLPGGLLGYSTVTSERPEWPEQLPVDHFLVKLIKRP